MGSAEYLTAFLQLVIPVARQFNPQLVLVAAGFDAAIGDVLGGCRVDPACYGHLTHLLSSLAEGRMAIMLEGGYNVASVSKSVVMCVKALLGHPLPTMPPFKTLRSSAVQTINETLQAHLPHWTILANQVKLLKVPSARSAQSLINSMKQLTMEPKVCLKKIGREELAGRARLGFLNPLDCPPAEVEEETLLTSVRIRTSGPPYDTVEEKAIKIQDLEGRIKMLEETLLETRVQMHQLQAENDDLKEKLKEEDK